MPMPQRVSRKRAPVCPTMDAPSITISPDVGFCRRLMVRTSVDLPAPLDPMMPNTSPSRMVRLTSSTAAVAEAPSRENSTWMVFSSIMERPSFATIA